MLKQQMNSEFLNLQHAKLDSSWSKIQDMIFKSNSEGKIFSDKELMIIQDLATFHGESEAARFIDSCTAST